VLDCTRPDRGIYRGMSELKTQPVMTEDGRRRLPTTNQPLNAEPRPTVGPLILTLVLVAAIVGLLVYTISLVSH
jgi:hypothetical protein